MRSLFLAFLGLQLCPALLLGAEGEAEPVTQPAVVSAAADESTRQIKLQSVADAAMISLHDGMLSVRVTDQADEEMRDFYIPKDPARYRIRALRQPGQAEPLSVTLERWMEIPGFSAQNTSIISGPMSVQISRDFAVENEHIDIDRIDNIVLVQSFGSAEEAPSVTLRAKRIASGKSAEMNIDEKDFSSLCTRHPREVADVLLPILRDLKQDLSLLAPSSETAWRILKARIVLEASTIARLDKILQQLDAPDARQRERASRELREIGPMALPWATRLDRSRLSAEQSNRLDRFLGLFPELDAKETEQLTNDPQFLLNLLYSNDAPLRKAAWEQLVSISPMALDSPSQRWTSEQIESLRARLTNPTTQPAGK